MADEREIQRTIHSLDPERRYVVRARTYNEFGQPSNWSEALEFTTPDTSQAPNPITNIWTSFRSPDLLIRWDPPTHNVDGSAYSERYGYKVTLSDPYSDATPLVYDYFTGTNSIVYYFDMNELDHETAKPEFDITVVAVNLSGIESSPVSTNAINAIPYDPESAPGAAVGASITLYFDIPSGLKDFESVVLQHSINGTSFSDFATVRGTTFSHPAPAGQTNYYRYKYQDVFGQVSANWSSIAGPLVTSAGGDLHYVHTQSTPAISWSINHALGKHPAIQAFDGSGEKITGQITHTDASNAVVVFNSIIVGVAYCN